MASRCTTAAALVAVLESLNRRMVFVHVPLHVHGEQGEAASGLAVREALVAVVLAQGSLWVRKFPRLHSAGIKLFEAVLRTSTARPREARLPLSRRRPSLK
jgi:hypothetical protein